MSTAKLKAPFPYFGGKSRVAQLVWDRFGDVANYIEPFCGSAAVLIARPTSPRIETVNDQDCYLANFWRATQQDPESVAYFADGPVNESDLHARHRWLVLSEEAADFRRRMRTDPTYYDVRFAGWWCWGLCCWIGSGWCQTPESAEWDQMPLIGTGGHGDGTIWVHKISGGPGKRGPAGGTGDLKQKRPRCATERSDFNPGVHGRPQLADAYSRGRGVHNDNHLSQQIPVIGTGGHGDGTKGVHITSGGGTCAQRREWLLSWFSRLRDLLRTVRVCCGHWKRVCDSESVTTRLGMTGVFLDPPYPTHSADGTESRSADLYATDGSQSDLDSLRDEVMAWCKERGADPQMRIGVCGYDTDGYASLESLGWEVVHWKAAGGYGNRSDKGKQNTGRERIWFSPACAQEARLFA